MNRVYGWQPEFYYNVTEVKESTEIPNSVKDQVEKTWNKFCKGKGQEIEDNCPRLRMIWLDCKGEFFSKVKISLVISTAFEFSRQKLDNKLLENSLF